jgi:hypothetical protein
MHSRVQSLPQPLFVKSHLNAAPRRGAKRGDDEMRRLGVAILLALIALSGVAAASAYDNPPITDPDPIQAP